MKISRAQLNAFSCGLLGAGTVFLGIYFGSGKFERFDAPLSTYAAATIFATFAILYRYTMWIQRPSTWIYFKSGWRLFLAPSKLIPNLLMFVKLLWTQIISQRFIEKRSKSRWAAHLCIAWGCMIAFVITFPLSWGWIQFSAIDEGRQYVVEFWGMPQFSFLPESILGFLIFNGLNISAILVLIGVAIAMHRRMFDKGAIAVQSVANDMIPLFLLFAVSITGLMITASYKLMAGASFQFISLLHAFTVVVLLLWLPFGKLFHVIQRPAQLGVAFYKEECKRKPSLKSPISGQEFQSEMHHKDLLSVMKEIDIDFGEHQFLSPQDKRKLIAINQAALIEGQPYIG